MPTSARPSPNKKRKTTHPPKGLFRTGRSVWNATDDWDELVAASSLSTSSISTRPPRLRGLQTLSRAAEGVAVRHFRMLWMDGKGGGHDGGDGGGSGIGRGRGEESEDGESGDECVKRGKKRKVADKGSRRGKVEKRDVVDVNAKGWWELQWPHVPDHLKCSLRDGVMRMHGGWLSMDVIRKLFLHPPEYVLPGHLLPALTPSSSTSRSKSTSKSTTAPGLRTIPLHPHPAYAKQMHTLKVQHCPQYSDAAVADIIRSMPNLQVVNLKGCSLVGTRTVEEICKLRYVRRVNLKGTRVGEGDVGMVMREKGETLEGFKVDSVAFKDPSSVFTSTYPRLTHLCLSGNLINGPRTTSHRAQIYTSAIAAPAPRATPADATFTWAAFGTFFPALTHLYLPGLLIPPSDRIVLARANTLVKLSLGIGGPAVPAAVLCDIFDKQKESLRSVHMGHVDPSPHPWGYSFGEELSGVEGMQDFRWIRDRNIRVSVACDDLMKRAGDILDSAVRRAWAKTLKHLHLELGHPITLNCLFDFTYPATSTSRVPETPPAPTALETLSLPNTSLSCSLGGPSWVSDLDPSALPAKTDSFEPYRTFRQLPHLRSLDLGGTDITTEQVYDVLDKCAVLSRVDLTSCRGVDVRLRRRVFGAWAESRGVEG